MDWSSAVGDGPGWRLHFAEVTTREAADELRGAYLECVAGPEAELARGEYFWHEVVGTAVRGVDGADLGTVRDVYRSGGAEVFLVGIRAEVAQTIVGLGLDLGGVRTFSDIQTALESVEQAIFSGAPSR